MRHSSQLFNKYAKFCVFHGMIFYIVEQEEDHEKVF